MRGGRLRLTEGLSSHCAYYPNKSAILRVNLVNLSALLMFASLLVW